VQHFGAYALTAIGWVAVEVAIALALLEPGLAYERGKLDDRFVRALVGLATDPFEPFVAAGGHRCGFCRLSGGCAFRYEGTTVAIGASNIFVPDGQRLFVAPSMILHSMDAHAYAPPANFQRAVLACPPMRSADSSEPS
jgi:hypothetical protein